jgi:catechol 2,3-dioxygenase-like lactoylglutathione lyase family enzyme
MTDTISKLLASYDKGGLSRRDLVQGLALLAAGAGTAQAAPFNVSSVNHISVQVSNLEKSSEFYQRVLGAKVLKRDGNNQVMFGRSYLVLRPGKPAAKVDHIAIGVDNFNMASVAAELKSRGATPIDQEHGFGFHVLDPDGFPLQLVKADNLGSGPTAK